MSIAVCIVNYNTRDLLRVCLNSLLIENPDEIVVIDNASGDRSVEMLHSEFPSVRLLTNPENTGYGAAANRAIRHCVSQHILLLNSDTIVKPGAVQALQKYMDKNASVAVTGPRILNLDGTIQTSCFHFPTPLHVFLYLTNLYRAIPVLPILRDHSLQSGLVVAPQQVSWVLGAAMGIRRVAFESVGGFDESYFMYFEEVDLCYRLARAGWQVHFSPSPQIIHLGGASTKQNKSQMTLQYFTSLQHFYRQHYSGMRRAQLFVFVQFMALASLIHRGMGLFFTRDPQTQARLTADMKLWKSLLLNGF